MNIHFTFRLLLPVFFLMCIQPVAAVKIVRLQLEYGGDGIATGGFAFPKVNKSLDLELFDDIAPVTVSNYLAYVNDGRYDLTFINRSDSGFVLQTGGVTNISSDPINDTLGSSFGIVSAFPSIINEPDLSNIRGTIAMAKISNQPDSATSEWFINLDNNSSLLDTTNGGFTVFGRVIDDGMVTADEIASFPVVNLSFIFGGSYAELPLSDYDIGGSENVFQRNLIMVLSTTEITRPILHFIPTDGDFGFHNPGDVNGASINVELKNMGSENLDINLLNLGTLSSPFSVQSENCTGASLDAASSCSINLLFSPVIDGVFEDSFTVDYVDQSTMESFSKTFYVRGEGASSSPVISVAQELDVGIAQAGGSVITKDLIVRNTGQAKLKVLNVSGLGSDDFTQSNDCLSTGLLISTENFCTITISFSTDDLGSKTDVLIIETNDPLNNTVNIVVNGFGDTDTDGVSSVIEQAGPNGGDGNNDGIDDAIQNNVVSFITTNGSYSTLVSEDAVIAKSRGVISETAIVGLVQTTVVDSAPASTSFDNGLYQFNVNFSDNGVTGDSVRVALYLPLDVKVKSYFRFGPTSDNTTPHWYDFAFDSETRTGASVLGEVDIRSPSGNTIKRNLILINFVDGLRGDDDLAVNGEIAHGVGGVDAKESGSSSGSASYLWIFSCLFMFRTVILRRP